MTSTKALTVWARKQTLIQCTSKYLLPFVSKRTFADLSNSKLFAESDIESDDEFESSAIARASYFHRFLVHSLFDYDRTLTLPLIEKLIEKIRENGDIERWSVMITSKVLNSLANLNKKSNWGLRRVVTLADLEIMQRNFVRDDFQLPPRRVHYACLALYRLQLSKEMENDEYPLPSFMSSLKAWVWRNVAFSSQAVLNSYEVEVTTLKYVNGVLKSMSMMKKSRDDEMIKLADQSLNRYKSTVIDGYRTFAKNRSSAVDKEIIRMFIRDEAIALFRCGDALMNCGVYADRNETNVLWTLWFEICAEFLKRFLDADLEVERGDSERLTTLISSMILSASYFNNLNEFLDIRVDVERCLLRLLPSAEPKSARSLLVQLKALESLVRHSSSTLKRMNLFNEDIWTLIRNRCSLQP